MSRGSYSRGKEVAEKLALALGYKCLSRDILLEASERYNIPEIKLIRAIHDAPSILERFTYNKEQYVAYIRAALLWHAQKDNLVYHGLAGHFLLQGIPHVLKVRILAGLEDRVQEEMKRENISADEARRILQKDDEELQGSCFQTTPEAQKLVDELSLAAQVESALVQEFPSIKVEAQGGEVFIYVKRSMWDDEDLMARIKRLAASVAGLEIQVNLRMLPK
ncbi:MAG: cytidylate kinase-like family protein [Syntrophobacterales bacterium]